MVPRPASNVLRAIPRVLQAPHDRELDAGAPVRVDGGLGAASSQRDVCAQSPAASTVYVPAEGLVFRDADGKPLARLVRGPHEGSLELYDDRAPRTDSQSLTPVRDRPGPGF